MRILLFFFASLAWAGQSVVPAYNQTFSYSLAALPTTTACATQTYFDNVPTVTTTGFPFVANACGFYAESVANGCGVGTCILVVFPNEVGISGNLLFNFTPGQGYYITVIHDTALLQDTMLVWQAPSGLLVASPKQTYTSISSAYG